LPVNDLSARRPLKTRSARWAGALLRAMLKVGIRPNQVSVMSVIFAIGSAACLLAIPCSGLSPALLWALAAVGIQLRLICNLMDGMLAVEGSLKSPNGDLYNEFPDRLSDTVILAALGYASGGELSITLGWLCASGALMTAAVRMHGASLTGIHDFSGPMAKPHRMALATTGCLVMAGLAVMDSQRNVLPWMLGILLAGVVVTLFRRLRSLSRSLHESTPSDPSDPPA
jgi:phosphatidylglycerophosphate synthase